MDHQTPHLYWLNECGQIRTYDKYLYLQKQKQNTSCNTVATTQPAVRYTPFSQSDTVPLLAPVIIREDWIPDAT